MGQGTRDGCNAAQTRKAERERYATDRLGRAVSSWLVMPDSVAALALQAHAQAALMGKAQLVMTSKC